MQSSASNDVGGTALDCPAWAAAAFLCGKLDVVARDHFPRLPPSLAFLLPPAIPLREPPHSPVGTSWKESGLIKPVGLRT